MTGPLLRKNYNIPLSIILPSRKRLEGLHNTLTSIYSLVDINNVNFEIIVKFDFDDTDSIDYIKEWNNQYENITFMVNSRRQGWLNMVDYVEDLIRSSRGEYILSINDDMVFKTQNWNTLLEPYLKDSFNIIFPFVNGYRESFPVFPRKIFSILGHISLHNQIDTYLLKLGERVGINKYIEEVKFYHDVDLRDKTHEDKAEVVDINFRTRNYHFNSPEFFSDVRTLKQFLNNEIL